MSDKPRRNRLKQTRQQSKKQVPKCVQNVLDHSLCVCTLTACAHARVSKPMLRAHACHSIPSIPLNNFNLCEAKWHENGQKRTKRSDAHLTRSVIVLSSQTNSTTRAGDWSDLCWHGIVEFAQNLDSASNVCGAQFRQRIKCMWWYFL